jgi:hypothetical protein
LHTKAKSRMKRYSNNAFIENSMREDSDNPSCNSWKLFKFY